MRMRTLMGAFFIILLATGIGRAAEQRRVADFRIVVALDAEKNQVVLKCSDGCVWTELTFTCREGEGCSSPVDEYGMTQ